MKLRYWLQCFGPNRVVVQGRVEGAGAGSPTVKKGEGYTVAWVSTGLYRFTLDKKYDSIESCFFNIGDTVPDGVKGFTAHPEADLASNQAFDVEIYNASQALADLASTQWLDFLFFLKNTGVR